MEIEKQIVKMKMELKSLTKPIISFTASIQRPAAEYNAIFDNSGKILKKSNWRVLEDEEEDEDEGEGEEEAEEEDEEGRDNDSKCEGGG